MLNQKHSTLFHASLMYFMGIMAWFCQRSILSKASGIAQLTAVAPSWQSEGAAWSQHQQYCLEPWQISCFRDAARAWAAAWGQSLRCSHTTPQCNVSTVLMTALLHHVQYSIGTVVMAAILCHDEDTWGYQQALLLCRDALQMPDLYTTS